MNDFVRKPLLKRLNKQNIDDRLRKVEARTGPRNSIRTVDIGNLGDIISGARFYAIDHDAGVVRMVMSGTNLYDEFAVNAHLAGFADNGTATFYVDSTSGALVAGAGAVTLDDDGITINVPAAETDVDSVKFSKGGTIQSRLSAYDDSTSNFISLSNDRVTGRIGRASVNALSVASQNAYAYLRAQDGTAHDPIAIAIQSSTADGHIIYLNLHNEDVDTIIRGDAGTIATFDGGDLSTTFGGNVTATNTNVRSGAVSINDDAVTSFAAGRAVGLIIVGTNQTGSGGMAWYKTSVTQNCLKIDGGANFAVATGALNGTTGTDGNLTVSANDANGLVYLENRTGGVRTFYYLLI